MPEPSLSSEPRPLWGADAGAQTLRQIAEVCRQITGLELRCTATELTTLPAQPPRTAGILGASAQLRGEQIGLRVELARLPEGCKIPAVPLYAALAALSQQARLLEPAPPAAPADEPILAVELKIQATPLSYARLSALNEHLRQFEALARQVQELLPENSRSTQARARRYQEFAGVLGPIEPWPSVALAAWAGVVVDYLAGGASVAMVAEFPVERAVAAAAVARALDGQEGGVGELLAPAIHPRGLVELALKAPGVLLAPAARLALGGNPYEESDALTMLTTLASLGRPALFAGSLDELQSVFHGGQGGRGDPLRPVVCHVPAAALALEELVEFAVWGAGLRQGGLSAAARTRLSGLVLAALQALDPAGQRRLLPLVAARVVAGDARGEPPAVEPARDFADRAGTLAETLTGFSVTPRPRRAPAIQARYGERLADPALLPYLRRRLLGQDRALAELVDRLSAEGLTRADHQPLRYCLQSTPGTGKSDSQALLARWLDIPYVLVDAASLPDHHTAAAQLLGSGRGIVGSFQRGRLEAIAHHHQGAVVEVADLDHAAPNVRAVLADLFLQLLETGEAQSAKGAPFSCANLIFCFTLNLPAGADERLRRGMGFTPARSHRELRLGVEDELKQLFSNAFLSRVGTPILFDPLGDAALAAILERGIAAALVAAARRRRIENITVELAPGLGARLLPVLEPNSLSHGARGLLESGRTLAARAFLDLIRRQSTGLEGTTWRVAAGAAGELIVAPEPPCQPTTPQVATR